MKKEGLGEILKFSFKSASQQPIIIVPVIFIALTFLSSALFTVLAFISVGMSISVNEVGLPALNASGNILTIFVIIELIILAATIALSAYFGIGLFSMAKEIDSGKKTNLKTMTKYGKKFFWRYIGVYAVVGLILIAAFTVAVLLSSLGNSLFGALTLGSNVFNAIISLTWILFAVLFAFAPYYLITQDKNIISSVKKSFEIVKKEYPLALGLIATFYVLSYLFNFIPFIGGILSLLLVPVKVLAYMRFALSRR